MKNRIGSHIKIAKGNSEKQAIHYAILKYGIEKFSIEIISQANSKNNIFELERFWIKYYNSRKNGYNETDGGDGGPIKTSFTKNLIINVINDYLLIPAKDIAKKYNLTIDAVRDICRGKFGVCHDIPEEIIDLCNKKRESSPMKKKVSEKLLINILKDYSTGNFTMLSIADKYSLSVANIYSIIHRNTFKNININKKILKKLDFVLSKRKKSQTSERKRKLDDNIALEIIKLYCNQKIKPIEISKKFNVNKSVVESVLHRRTFKHLDIKEYEGVLHNKLKYNNLFYDRKIILEAINELLDNKSIKDVAAKFNITEYFLSRALCLDIFKDYEIPDEILNKIRDFKSSKKLE
jgi:predicted transcriptional regulator